MKRRTRRQAVILIDDERIDYYWNRMRRARRGINEFSWPSVGLVLNLTYANELLNTALSRAASRIGLSRAALNVLSIISQSEGKGCAQNRISRLTLVSRANVTGLVDNLIRQGLVKRVPHTGDRRVMIARITPKGERLLESFLPEYFQEMRHLTGCLNVREKAFLMRLLDKLRAGIVKAARGKQ